MRQFSLAHPEILEQITGQKVGGSQRPVTAEEAKAALRRYAEANPELYEAIMGHKKKNQLKCAQSLLNKVCCKSMS